MLSHTAWDLDAVILASIPEATPGFSILWVTNSLFVTESIWVVFLPTLVLHKYKNNKSTHSFSKYLLSARSSARYWRYYNVQNRHGLYSPGVERHISQGNTQINMLWKAVMSAKKENIEHFEIVKKADLATSWTWKGSEMLTCKRGGWCQGNRGALQERLREERGRSNEPGKAVSAQLYLSIPHLSLNCGKNTKHEIYPLKSVSASYGMISRRRNVVQHFSRTYSSCLTECLYLPTSNSPFPLPSAPATTILLFYFYMTD